MTNGIIARCLFISGCKCPAQETFSMNILVLQHIAIEDPGYIKDLMLADGSS